MSDFNDAGIITDLFEQRDMLLAENEALKHRIKQLEQAGDALKTAGYFGGWGDAVNKWVKVKEGQP